MKEKKGLVQAIKNNNYSAPALDKGLDILELLSKSEQGLSQQEIAVNLGKNINEIYRMLNCLVARNYIFNESNRYTLTSKLFQLSHFHPPTYRLLSEALPVMEKLSMKSSFSCDLRVYNNGSQTVIAAIQPPSGLGFMTRVGSKIKVGPSASGYVLVAFQDPAIRDLRINESLLGESEKTHNNFKKEIKKVLKNGFSSIKSNQYAGLQAVSFPIFDSHKNAIAALTVPMLARIDNEEQVSVEFVIKELKKAAEIISNRIALNR
jgi:DNA-binding IclR family transcriptional regulator